MPTHRTYMIVIEADERYDQYYGADGNIAKDFERVEQADFADTEQLHFILQGGVKDQGIVIHSLEGYA